ncbi:hypothetical protein [Cryptosporangium phraense]|uniref:Uncharacterized protein n=1 Tax=Cryptosporangium phraense TaxID=2593070 RepID=A0A545AN59_9ACTN|nr:hypothetical protein [Cryptosporangium phraense]TQS42774.1 hypothetical protein FL583_22180 [Cryptosporangium phraense]
MHDDLERLVVHLDEAVRLALIDNEAHLRLSLILFDGAFELMMHREITPWMPLWRNIYEAVVENEAAVRTAGAELPPEEIATRVEFRAKGLSKSQATRIERDFAAKIDRLVAESKLTERDGRLAKRLHDYRNETYHRDHVRKDSIRLAVAAYGDIACRFLRDTRPLLGIPWSSHPKPVPLGLRPYFSSEREMAGLHAWAVAGQTLLERLGPLDPVLPAKLSLNLVERIRQARASLLDFLGLSNETDSKTSKALDRLLFAFERDLSDTAAIVDLLKQFESGRRGKVTTRTIDGWMERAEHLAAIQDPLDAFVGFIDIELEFEPLENNAKGAVIALDRMIEDEIDRRRLK